MVNPLSVIFGGSTQAHQQREAQIAEADATKAAMATGVPATPPPAAPPVQQAPPTQTPVGSAGSGRQSFLSSAAVAPPQQNTSTKTLLGQ